MKDILSSVHLIENLYEVYVHVVGVLLYCEIGLYKWFIFYFSFLIIASDVE